MMPVTKNIVKTTLNSSGHSRVLNRNDAEEPLPRTGVTTAGSLPTLRPRKPVMKRPHSTMLSLTIAALLSVTALLPGFAQEGLVRLRDRRTLTVTGTGEALAAP